MRKEEEIKMKRNLVITMLVSGVIVSSLMTGCGNKEAAPSSTSTTQAVTVVESEAETTVKETEKGSVETSNKNDDYFSWTGKEWKSASDEEKKGVAKAYLIENMNIAAKAAGQDLGGAVEAAITPEAVSATVDTLDMTFSADENIKLQDILDLASNATDMMMESAAQ